MTKQGYLFSVADTAIESWRRQNGAKQVFWSGILPMFALMLIDSSALNAIDINVPWLLIVCIPLTVLIFLIGAGLIHTGICRANDQPITFKTVLYAFQPKVMLHLLGLLILQSIILCIPAAFIMLGLHFMTLSSTYQVLGMIVAIAATLGSVLLTLRILFSVAFILDHDEKPFTSVKKSIRVTSGNFWQLIGFLYMSVVIFIAGAICALIGLIWIIPFWYIWYGRIYSSLAKNNL